MSFKKYFPVYLIFLSMGMVDAASPMVSLARESFTLPITLAALLPFTGYLMFGVLAIPMGILQDKKRKVFILNTGLVIMLIGLMIPVLSGMYGNMVVNSTSLRQFYWILLAVLFIGAGGSIMQVGGNPFIRDISEEGDYSKNLSMAQSFITIGSSFGFLLPALLYNLLGLDWSILFPVYAAIVLTALFWFNMTRIKEVKQKRTHHASLKSSVSLLKDRYVLAMVTGIFIYCGVEVAIASHVPILLTDKFMFSLEKIGLLISWSLFYLPIFLGRFLGAFILRSVTPDRLLLYTGVLSFLGILIILLFDSLIVVLIGVLFAGFGFANIFPLLFSITIDKKPEYQNELSGLMVTMIVGGTFVPVIMGSVADIGTITLSFIVPLACTGYILFLGIINNKRIPRSHEKFTS
ncbi:MAG: sugar MFS transporter [Mangrovibacterium sp.]